MTLTWYGSQVNAESCNFGNLAVIVPLLERMKVAEIINRHIPADPQAEFDHGTILSLLVAARLSSPVALSNVGAWAADTGADILWDMPIEKINDYRFGRSLDVFFAQRHSILATLALHVAYEFDVPLNEVHYDPTHILFSGAYEDAQPRGEVVAEDRRIRSDDQLPPAHITKGRPMHDAPRGARMIHAGLCTYVDQFGPLPFFGHTVDGNKNGHTAVAEQLALMGKHLRRPELTLFSDRGTYSVGHLARLLADGYHAVCSAPWDEFRPLFDKHRKKLSWKKASYLSVEQQRRCKAKSKLLHEHYELAVMRHQLTDPETHRHVPCRVVFVFSTADQKVVCKKRQQQIEKLKNGLAKIEKSVVEGRRNTTPQAIAKRVAKLFGKKQAAQYFDWEMKPFSKKQQSKQPKPQRGCSRPTHRFAFRFHEKQVNQDEQYDGYSVVVTTVPQNRPNGGADTLFTKFKEQNYSEQVNGQFKGPLAVSPVFLHSPRRVEALVFLMVITLMLYYLVQRMYRQTVPADAPQKDRRTTTRAILHAFESYTLLIHRTRFGREVRPTHLTPRQRELLNRLGFSTPAQILAQRLPRAPT